MEEAPCALEIRAIKANRLGTERNGENEAFARDRSQSPGPSNPISQARGVGASYRSNP